MSPNAFDKKDHLHSSRVAGASALSLLLLLGQSTPLLANPTGGAVVAGAATIGAAGKTLTINQSTTNAIINWQTFSIANGETTKFLVPSSSAATLNYVLSGNPSAIYGTLTSNGRLFLINPSGILVGSTGRIDTASFLGSTLNANNSAFLSGGDLQFSGSSTASIINQGSINASSGNVFLIANEVSNAGSLTAPQGDVGLAAGSSVLLQQDGDQHLFVQSNPLGTTRAVGVSNAGTISAASAELRAAGGNAYALAINNSGAIAATGYKKVNGQVYLTADTGAIVNSGSIGARGTAQGGTVKLLSQTGTITNSGSIDASATGAGGNGGSVTLDSVGGLTVDTGAIAAKGGAGGVGGNAEVSGDVLQFSGSVNLTAAGGKTGNLTLDPGTLNVITGGTGTITSGQNDSTSTAIAPSTVDAALASANLTLNANTNITISNALAWSSGSTLTLSTNTSGSTIVINAGITAASGGLTIDAAGEADQITTGSSGAVSVGSFTLQSGSWVQNSATLPVFSATNNFKLSNSSSFLRVTGGNGTSASPYQIADVYGLEGLASPSKNYLTSDAELVNNISASVTANWNSGAGWTPIGSYDGENSSDSNAYSGTFNGQNFTISALTIDAPSSGFTGLFGDTSTAATLENLNLTGVNITGNYYVGALNGVNNATVTNCTTSGTVTGNSIVGGMFGIIGGAVSDSSSSGTVIGTSSSDDIGGLAGYAQFGSITNCSSSANVLAGTSNSTYDVGGLVGVNYITITSSSASGTVTGQGYVGGLVGYNSGGTITSSNSSANVTGGTDVGGLLGENYGTVSESYATGSVDGNTAVGGLVGDHGTGTISQSYATASTTGSTQVGGLVGSNTGAIVNSFSTGTVTGTVSDIGGLIGENEGGSVVDSYTASTVIAENGSVAYGGLVGLDSAGAYTNVFWDTSTTPQSQGVGSYTGSVSPTGITGVTTNLLESSSYINGNSVSPLWDFTSIWTTNGGTTIPQLMGVGGPGGAPGSGSSLDTLSGIAYTDNGLTASSDVTIDLIFDGSVIDTGTTSGSGVFSFSVSATDVGDGLLLTDATDKGNTYFQSGSSSTSFSGIDLWGSTLRVVADTASNTALKTTIGNLTADGINYAVSGTSLTTHTGVNMEIVNGTYTIDGNITAPGTLYVDDGASLTGSVNATLQGASVTIDAGLDDTGALTIHSTSGEIQLDEVGNSDSPAVVDGLTLTATGAVDIESCYLTLPSGNFSATGTGYTSLTNAFGEANGINIYDSNILLSGGNFTLTGAAGYTTTEGVLSSGLGVAIGTDGETQVQLATTGSGSITITGIANQSVNSKSLVGGVYIYEDTSGSLNNYISVENGALTINGTVSNTTASGTGVNAASITGVGIEAGTQIVATGSGSVAITGNTASATTDVEGGNFSFINGVEIGGQVGVTSGNLTITGTGGTLNTSNSTINAANQDDDGTGNYPSTAGVIIAGTGEEGAENILSGSGSTVTIVGTGGAVVTTGAYTGLSGGVSFNTGSSADFGTAPDPPPFGGVEPEIVSNTQLSGSTVSITGTGGAVNAGDGSNSGNAITAGVNIDGAITVEDGGSLTVHGTGGALNISNATAVSGSNFPSTEGVRIKGGAVVAGLGSSSLTFIGTGGAVTAGTNRSVASVGVDAGADNGDVTTLSVQDGTLTITGTAGSSPSMGAGVLFHGTNGGQTVLEGEPDEDGVNGTQIVITGTGGAGYAGTGTFVGNYVPDDGVIFADNIAVTTPYGVSITGHGGANSNGVAIVNLTNDSTLDAMPVSSAISADQITITSTNGNVLVDAGLTSTGGITITSPGALTLLGTGGTDFSTGNLTFNAGGAILIDNVIGGDGTDTVASSNGNITLGTASALSDEGSGNVLSLAAGTSLPHSHYVINDSSLGSGVITVSSGASFQVYQADSASNTTDNISFTPNYSQYGATYPATGLPSGNGLLYFVGSSSDVGPNSPFSPPPVTPPTIPVNLLNMASMDDNSGSNLVPVSTVPQNGDVQLPGGDLPGNGGTPGNPSLNFGTNPGNTGGNSGGLANSSGNGGLIGPNDAGQLGGGALSNFQNPAVYSAFGNALGVGVYDSLSAALGENFYPADSQSGGPGLGNGETYIGAGGVVVIQNGQITNVPAGQVPNQLNNALNKGTLNNMPGH